MSQLCRDLGRRNLQAEGTASVRLEQRESRRAAQRSVGPRCGWVGVGRACWALSLGVAVSWNRGLAAMRRHPAWGPECRPGEFAGGRLVLPGERGRQLTPCTWAMGGAGRMQGESIGLAGRLEMFCTYSLGGRWCHREGTPGLMWFSPCCWFNHAQWYSASLHLL